MKKIHRTVALACMTLLTFLIVLMPTLTYASEVVNIYSARKEALILPLLEKFRDETGIQIYLITGKADGLLKRIQLEGKATPADVFITVDAGRLQRAKKANVLQPINSERINSQIPENLRDVDDYWISLSQRARTIFYARDRVNPDEMSTYEQLADPIWRGRLCVRSSGNIYNQSLIASMIESIGPEATLEWAKNLVLNFARPPSGGDTDQIKAVAAGQCDIALANTYYYGRIASSTKKDDKKVTERVGVFWPNQAEGDRGVHVNVSGAGITAHAKNRDNALRLLEFLVTPESQSWYAEVNQEYPVLPGVPASDTLENLGSFKADELNLTILGVNNLQAVEIMDKAGWK